MVAVDLEPIGMDDVSGKGREVAEPCLSICVAADKGGLVENDEPMVVGHQASEAIQVPRG